MRYELPSGLIVDDRRVRSDPFDPDEPRTWPPNDNINPPPPPETVGPNASEGFGNTHVMVPSQMWPPMQAWSGWPVEWNTPNWGSAVGVTSVMERVSTVFGCIDLNGSILSTMPPYRMASRVVTDPLPWMSNPQPEIYTGWTEMMKQLITSFYGGDAFLWCTSRYADGTVRNFVVLDPAWVHIEMLGQVRTYTMNEVDITADVLHLRYVSWPGIASGLGPLEALASNIFGVEMMERYEATLASRGGIPWAILTAPGNLSSTQATDLRDNFVAARLSAVGAPAVLSGGVTLSPLTLSPKDMALLELRQFDEARICQLLGVPPLLMGLPSGDSVTYRNAEGIYDFHWRAYLRPKAATITEAISHWALPSTQSLELNRDDYVKPSFAERVNGYKTLFEIVDPISGQRAMTIDEIREAERLAVLDNTQPLPETPPTALTITEGQGAGQ